LALGAGTRLGRYEILAPIGAGGMGEVYRARDSHLERDVAVKVLPASSADDPESRARFEREARAVAALPHPNIVAIHDVGHEGDLGYAVLELLEGETLRERLLRGPLPWRSALEIAVPVAEALAAAHARGIVHRDLKPENVFLTHDGRTKILDFGIARRFSPEPSADTSAATLDATRPGVVIGTLSYLSPEQARGERVDGRSDIFTFGAVLYEMLTARRAFSAPTSSETMVAILRDEPAEPEGLGAAFPRELWDVIRRCLEKSRERRFQSASDLAFALTAVGRSADRGTGAGRAAAQAVSVAVLPFRNLSPDRENEYFSDGMTEELINTLAQVPGLRVAARTSSFAFKEKQEDVRTIGERLGVRSVLEGSVRRAGDRLRVSVQLVNAADGYHVWSENYDRNAVDVLSVQEEIARSIAGRLRSDLGLAAEERTPAPDVLPRMVASLDRLELLLKRGTADPEAYNLYLKGRYFWNRRTLESSRKAIGYFEQAIVRDPAYALAYAGLSDSYVGRAKDEMAKAKAAAEKAVALDDNLAEGHAALARALFYHDWNWAGAEREFRRALELNPFYPETHHIYSHFLLPSGRIQESMTASRRALDLDPLSVSMVAHVGWHLVYAGSFEESMPYSRAAIDMDGSFFAARIHLGMALEALGRLDEAIDQFRRAGEISSESSESAGSLGHALAMAGRSEEARAVLDGLEARPASRAASPFDCAVVWAGLGERDRVFEWLGRAADERLPSIVEIRADPRFRPVSDDPRFTALVRRVGIPEGGA
jgi:TolB-like protein/Tfp pilus assembly protein PilF